MSIFRSAGLVALLLLASASFSRAADIPAVRTLRILDGGVQPQAAVDAKGVVHLIYLKGDPGQSDIFYIRSTDSGRTFSAPLRVNSQPGSAMAVGTVRGAHLALGKGGRVHVAWPGSSQARPRPQGKGQPMLYARLSDDGTSFEPQRNVSAVYPSQDACGSIAADAQGNVFVAWHAPQVIGEGEESARIFLTRSTDEGKTFAAERAITTDRGVCGCCGTVLFATDDAVYALYRTADHKLQRDMTLVRLDSGMEQPRIEVVGAQQSATCLMSTSALAPATRSGAVGAWEANGQIYWSPIAAKGDVAAVAVPGRAGGRKHPAIASNAAGDVLVVWTEGTGWNKGGTISWQVYDASGQAPRAAAGRADRLPAWGTPAAFACPDGSFVIVY